MKKRYMTQQEVADVLGVSIFTIRKWRVTGRCPAVRIGAKWHIPVEWVDAFVAEAQKPETAELEGADEH